MNAHLCNIQIEKIKNDFFKQKDRKEGGAAGQAGSSGEDAHLWETLLREEIRRPQVDLQDDYLEMAVQVCANSIYLHTVFLLPLYVNFFLLEAIFVRMFILIHLTVNLPSTNYIQYLLYCIHTYVQFGQLSMFAVAFPLAPLVAYLNNVWEFGVDYRKLSQSRRPPVAIR